MLSVLFFRIANAYIPCCRISNPTERREDDRSAVFNTARSSEISARLFRNKRLEFPKVSSSVFFYLPLSSSLSFTFFFSLLPAVPPDSLCRACRNLWQKLVRRLCDLYKCLYFSPFVLAYSLLT